MRRYARTASFVLVLGLLGAVPSASPATSRCGSTKFRVGSFCVTQTISNSKGTATLEHKPRTPGQPASPLGVLVHLNGPFTGSCSDGSTDTLPALGGLGGFAPIHGAKFSVTNVATSSNGRLTRTVNGRYVSNTEVIVSYKWVFEFFAPVRTCTILASNVKL